MADSVKPTFKSVNHAPSNPHLQADYRGRDFSDILETNTKIVNLLAKSTQPDFSVIEEKLDEICAALRDRKPTPITVQSADPIIQTHIQTPEAPVVNVSSPTVKVEPQNKVIVMINPLWLLLATIIPTIAILLDMYFRAKGK